MFVDEDAVRNASSCMRMALQITESTVVLPEGSTDCYISSKYLVRVIRPFELYARVSVIEIARSAGGSAALDALQENNLGNIKPQTCGSACMPKDVQAQVELYKVTIFSWAVGLLEADCHKSPPQIAKTHDHINVTTTTCVANF